jgi:hypothetical protein
MKFALKPLLVFVGILALLGGLLVFKNFQTIMPAASLLIETPNFPAEAFLDDQSLGQTPLQKDNLANGEYNLKLISGEQIYQTKIQLLGGTQTMVRREFGPTDTFSSGVVVWFEKSGRAATASITSEPDGVGIKIDGKDAGQAPLLVEDFGAGTHDLHLSLEKFETRTESIILADGYQLRVAVKLALRPLPETEPSQIDFGGEKVAVHNLSPTETLFTDPTSLTRGIIYWAATRGLGVEKVQPDYFVDSQGVIYDRAGQPFDPEAFTGEQVETVAVGYLGQEGETDLSDKAQASLTTLTRKVLVTPPVVEKVRILPTGTGWLRVRAEPSLSASEITKVNVSESFELLEEKEGWVRIKLPDGQVGWVSSDFTEKFQEGP